MEGRNIYLADIVNFMKHDICEEASWSSLPTEWSMSMRINL